MPARMKAALARKAAQANSSSTSKPPAAVASVPKETSDHSEPARKESRAAKTPSGPPPLGAILALASVLQWYWGLSIVRSFQRRARSRAAKGAVQLVLVHA